MRKSWRMLRNNEKKEIKWLLFENDLKQNVKQIVCFNKKKRWAFKFWKWEVEGWNNEKKEIKCFLLKNDLIWNRKRIACFNDKKKDDEHLCFFFFGNWNELNYHVLMRFQMKINNLSFESIEIFCSNSRFEKMSFSFWKLKWIEYHVLMLLQTVVVENVFQFIWIFFFLFGKMERFLEIRKVEGA